jgi:hypothetical protein
LVLLYADYNADPQRVLKQVFAFLGVDTSFEPDTSQRLNVSKAPKFKFITRFLAQNPALKSWMIHNLPKGLKSKLKGAMFSQQALPKMTPEERSWLLDFYREEVDQLERLINRDLSSWRQ